ncbi:MAG TPA: TetR/AcrR family transcriptional regulator [Fulvivirga sp.]|nr:TetR/AcrR family transcriptional regulator [Fulvivirga sp.]
MDKITILKESFTLFRKYGVKSVSMDDIAHRLTISKKTLYTYFDNKEDLLLNGIRKIFRKFHEAYEQISTDDPHPLIALSVFYCSVLKEIAHYESAYFYSINKYSITISTEIETQRNKLISDIVKPLFNEANALQCLREGVDLDLFITLNLLMIEERYTQAISMSSKLSMTHVYKQLIVYPIIGICKPECSEQLLTELEVALKKFQRS